MKNKIIEMKNEERRMKNLKIGGMKKDRRTKEKDVCPSLLSFCFKVYILLLVYQNLSIH